MADHLKIAVGAEGVERLRRERDVLDVVRHPGVVELLGFTDEGGVAELRTAGVDGPPLAATDALSDDELAGLAAAVATTLADLHDAGVVHAGLDASHILLSTNGPVLCGFGNAGAPGPDRQPADDVAALGRVVLERVEQGPVAEMARSLSTRTAREAADACRTCLATATLPGRPRTTSDTDELAELLGRGARRRRRRPARRWLIGALVATAVTGGGGALLLDRPASVSVEVAAPRETTTTTTAVPPTTPPAPTATLVWPPPSGPTPTFELDARRYAVGGPGDVVATGPFGCDGAGGAAAVLRPADGRVFVFDRLASEGDDVTGREVAMVLGGRSLRADDADGDGCVDLLVEREGGAAPVPVALEHRTATS